MKNIIVVKDVPIFLICFQIFWRELRGLRVHMLLVVVRCWKVWKNMQNIAICPGDLDIGTSMVWYQMQSTGPPRQSAGSPQTDAGVGIGMKITGILIFNEKKPLIN